jgi:hypothetical protein
MPQSRISVKCQDIDECVAEPSWKGLSFLFSCRDLSSVVLCTETQVGDVDVG